LNFNMEITGKNLSVLVFQDMMPAKDFKQLKICLMH